MVDDLKILQEKYPELISYTSLNKTYDNRSIFLVKLGKGDINVVLEGGNHAREYASTPILMKMIEEYSDHYENNKKIHDYDLREILDKVTFYIFPMLNPDGVTLAREGIDAINDEGLKKDLLKMVNGNTKLFPQWKANIRGVDLNRNYPCKTWGNFENGKVADFRSKPSAYYFGGYASSPVQWQV